MGSREDDRVQVEILNLVLMLLFVDIIVVLLIDINLSCLVKYSKCPTGLEHDDLLHGVRVVFACDLMGLGARCVTLLSREIASRILG